MKQLFLIFGLSCLMINLMYAQLSGTISDAAGEPLPFASVYVQGTSIGTTSNIDGDYILELDEGEYELIYQYVGYQQIVKQVTISTKKQILDIVLEPVSTGIEEVVVKAGEDPAYPVIRKAIKKRKYYLNQVDAFSCKAYVKGNQQITDLPEKILGQSLEELEEELDETGTGIVYLSESVSELHIQKQPDKTREVMISSKVSGNDNGLSFNSGRVMYEMSFYQNFIDLGESKLLSPIGSGALGSYKYELISTFFDEKKRMVYKIKVIPKNSLGQLFSGFIYIVDEAWSIHSTELYTTGKAANISVLDTLVLNQIYISLQDSVQRLFSHNIQFKLKVLGIGIQGQFLGVFQDYNLNPNFEKNFFGAEVVKIEETANKKDSIYWSNIRPVPLTPEETRDYEVKDSLQKIWTSKAYLDSIDKVNNKPKVLDILLSGYSYRNSHKRLNFYISSPLLSFSYNTVQGYNINMDAGISKYFDEERTKWMDIKGYIEYGFSDRQVRGYGRFRYKFNGISDPLLQLEGGRQLRQINNNTPISPIVNIFYSLLLRNNYAKFYDDYYGKIRYSQRITNGLYMRASLSYGQRHSVINENNHSWFSRNREYFSNQPLDDERPPMANETTFATYEYLLFDLKLRIRIGQKFVSYPKYRSYTASQFPDIWLHYRKGIPLLGADTDFDYLAMIISKEDWSIGSVGLFSMRLHGIWFPTSRNLPFVDFAHVNGNRTIFARSNAYLNTFQLLPYYDWSVNNWLVTAHFEHNFNGFIWNKIPLLKHLGFEFVAGYHFLYTPENGEYMEFTLGIDRIGWKLFRFLRVDAVMNYQVGERPRFGAVLGLKFSL